VHLATSTSKKCDRRHPVKRYVNQNRVHQCANGFRISLKNCDRFNSADKNSRTSNKNWSSWNACTITQSLVCSLLAILCATSIMKNLSAAQDFCQRCLFDMLTKHYFFTVDRLFHSSRRITLREELEIFWRDRIWCMIYSWLNCTLFLPWAASPIRLRRLRAYLVALQQLSNFVSTRLKSRSPLDLSWSDLTSRTSESFAWLQFANMSHLILEPDTVWTFCGFGRSRRYDNVFA